MRAAPKPVLQTALLALALASLGGCDTKGDNIPLEVAKYQLPKPVTSPVVQIQPEPGGEVEEGVVPGAAADQPVSFANRHWQATATEYQLPERMLRPVGALGALSFYVLAWDQPPYDRLLVRAEGQPLGQGATPAWREFLDIY